MCANVLTRGKFKLILEKKAQGGQMRKPTNDWLGNLESLLDGTLQGSRLISDNNRHEGDYLTGQIESATFQEPRARCQ